MSAETCRSVCRCIASFGLPVLPDVHSQKPGESASVAAVLVFGLWPRGALDAALRSAGNLTQSGVPVAAESVNRR